MHTKCARDQIDYAIQSTPSKNKKFLLEKSREEICNGKMGKNVLGLQAAEISLPESGRKGTRRPRLPRWRPSMMGGVFTPCSENYLSVLELWRMFAKKTLKPFQEGKFDFLYYYS